MNADPYVTDDSSERLDRQGSDDLVERIRAHWSERGFGLWAVEVPGVAPFVGFVGLADAAFTSSLTPSVELDWRLAHEFWGVGYATDCARAALAFAFEQLRLVEVVCLPASTRLCSRYVMEKVGMHQSSSEDFDDPSLPDGHPLQRHVLYRLSGVEWARRPPVPDHQTTH